LLYFIYGWVNTMLVEFRIKNFRSLRDEQVLSLVASKDKTLQDTHTLSTGLRANASSYSAKRLPGDWLFR